MSNSTSTSTLSSFDYLYYLDGNQSRKTYNQNQITNYEYDGLARLKRETTSNSDTLYTYDLSSNRKNKSTTGQNPLVTNYQYDDNDRLVWEESTAGSIIATTEYFYDPNGNQISKLYNDITNLSGATASLSLNATSNNPNYEYWEFDGFNRLTTYTNPTTTAQYAYNPAGLRISKNVNGQISAQIWYGDNIVLELNNSGQVIDRYIRGKGLIRSDLNGYYLYNAHGDTVQLVNQQLAVTRNYLYDSFGNELGVVPVDNNPFRYCGEYLDSESGNIYLRARYYDPSMGRFVSEDSYEGKINQPLSLNLYTYCYNNPIIYTDPSGNFAISADGKWAHGGAANNSSSTTISDVEAEKRGLHVFENGVDKGVFKSNQGTSKSGSNTMILANRKPGKTPPKSWPPLPDNLTGKKPTWNPKGYWEGAKGDHTWDDRSHGSGVDRGNGPQDGHWDDEKSNGRWDRYGNPLPIMPVPTPTPQPSLYDKLGEITGLSGTALTVYFVISEGSRLFPPRDLVPVP